MSHLISINDKGPQCSAIIYRRHRCYSVQGRRRGRGAEGIAQEPATESVSIVPRGYRLISHVSSIWTLHFAISVVQRNHRSWRKDTRVVHRWLGVRHRYLFAPIWSRRAASEVTGCTKTFMADESWSLLLPATRENLKRDDRKRDRQVVDAPRLYSTKLCLCRIIYAPKFKMGFGVARRE